MNANSRHSWRELARIDFILFLLVCATTIRSEDDLQIQAWDCGIPCNRKDVVRQFASFLARTGAQTWVLRMLRHHRCCGAGEAVVIAYANQKS